MRMATIAMANEDDLKELVWQCASRTNSKQLCLRNLLGRGKVLRLLQRNRQEMKMKFSILNESLGK